MPTSNSEDTASINVDPNEVAKFEQLASRWWDRNSEFKPLHDINPLRANWIDKLAPVAEQKVLDVGCGGGILCEAMAQRGADVTGIDMGEAPLAVGKLHKFESGVEVDYQKSTAEDFAQSHPEQFDIVTCLEMLEHVPDPGSVVRACAAMTKPGGTLFFSTINRNPKAYLLAIIGVEYVLRMLPKGTHEYGKFIRPAELGQWIREAGLELDQMTGLTYNPITKTYRLTETDVDVNYMICARKPA
ncbi:bifunctional 2-polyprenyl-6-hydroxyphenol methylase/3-demethylubiquinol 3-O-methyltransferase UbiG [bacterium]|jgi:2-polyprenyl-6-hydroxyphenyl methylase/3-demethylubiquinone-9 3-methyltransferase|nr:bifunctional 2-polyprenyl-6-hydroxyphenol methylase/3-demethylubiquinol 3-O-methyltransferase UbiG [Porticoccaceae bacterium]MDB4581080.1 bifunctional 2-polyprenyl-6-hydroxyphenol methylase/3-demethylubiquinol 3-O-methyltransferase UbiG [Porticoccaceae bacterium]MDC0590249.1 bifunctional 2-polyprenyl-6-hydroxyphenol methylase/3-demethylubiquinol 3-O-methyltransferase UbiG [Porticoccaceae bacterium]MDC3261337.1 bifunctional 2-polyprenyl-6-hydroxyphenol methylase/3-demethylubiquinol 3-O-methylt